jgi:hypothetical protein
VKVLKISNFIEHENEEWNSLVIDIIFYEDEKRKENNIVFFFIDEELRAKTMMGIDRRESITFFHTS